ncbi:MAG: HAD-IA family hydrolase [Zoogloeaceae bacterium]|nr:HAD-IA family hydrolase [Rhodocyclaceae bacterium]MCP5294492.1 HAD-IA family hydrolase [Zoogloeaceae bacterium]
MTEAVFFDLDGTLADTAPDLAGALNRVRLEQGEVPVDPALLRPWTSNGVAGMLWAGFSITREDPRYPDLAERFLAFYEQSLCLHTRLFDGMAELLSQLESRGIRWGVVTNKSIRLTRPLLAALKVDTRASAIVGGDSAAAPKPAPDPLFLACSQASVSAANCIYVGDHERDIVSGKAAGMRTVAARYGYLAEGCRIEDWRADVVISQPLELLKVLECR